MHELVFKVKMACTLFPSLLADLVDIFVCVLWTSYWLFLSASSTIASRLVSRSQTLTQQASCMQLAGSWRQSRATYSGIVLFPELKVSLGTRLEFFSPAWPFDFFRASKCEFPWKPHQRRMKANTMRWEKTKMYSFWQNDSIPMTRFTSVKMYRCSTWSESDTFVE